MKVFLLLYLYLCYPTVTRQHADAPGADTNSTHIRRFITLPSFNIQTNSGFFGTVFNIFQNSISAFINRAEKWTLSQLKTKRVTYKNYQLFRVEPQNKKQVGVLEAMGEEVDGIEFWNLPAKKKPSDILIAPDAVEDAIEYFQDNDMEYEVIIRDLQKAIVYENPKMTRDQREMLVGKRGHPMTWARYHRYSDMIRYMEFLVYSYPNTVELITIGYSTKGLPLKVVKVSSDNARSQKDVRTSVWIDGGMSGREWVAPSVVLYMVKQLVENQQRNKELNEWTDWYFMPMANPDGYEYAHVHDRLWSKTRSSHQQTTLAGKLFTRGCLGVDLNKNFNFQWSEAGLSGDPCQSTYGGPKAFSEPESQAIANFLMQHNNTIQLFITLRAYSQTWFLPWTFSSHDSIDYGEMLLLARKAVDAINKETGMEYNIGPASGSPSCPGSSDDWAKGVAGIKYAYRVELRDQSNYGYVLPATQIIPTAREAFAAITAVTKSIITNN